MKKIIVDKNDSVQIVIAKMMHEPHTDIAVVIPKESTMRASINNFYVLKKEADRAGRTVVVESVDDEVLAFARASNFTAVHPLFHGDRRGQVISDIVFSRRPQENIDTDPAIIESTGAADGDHLERKARGRTVALSRESAPAPESVDEHEREMTDDRVEVFASGQVAQSDSRVDAGMVPDEQYAVPTRSRRSARAAGRFIFRFFFILLFIAFASGIIFITQTYFAKATIVIEIKKVSWNSSDRITADVAASGSAVSNTTIPAELFFQQKNFTQLFPASDVRDISQKATGRITIYNAFSSQPQSLVASTRFITDSGKVFRITESVKVPGALIQDGKITPATLEASVVADASGDSYNIAAATKMRIPGFSGTPKYDGFYGIIQSASGGFQGKRPVPSADDITKGKQRVSEVLAGTLNGLLGVPRVQEFKILPGATDVQIPRITVNSSTDATGQFSVFAEGMLQAIGFREKSVSDIVRQKAIAQTADKLGAGSKAVNDISLSYSEISPRFDRKQVQFTVAATATVSPDINAGALGDQLAGQSLDNARRLLSGLPDVTKATISVWPFWKKTLPMDSAKISVSVR